MARRGLFDPELRHEALFDDLLVLDGWVDDELIDIVPTPVPPIPPIPPTPIPIFYPHPPRGTGESVRQLVGSGEAVKGLLGSPEQKAALTASADVKKPYGATMKTERITGSQNG